MLQFIDGESQFLSAEECTQLKNGDFFWEMRGKPEETYVAGIDFAGQGEDATHISIIRIDQRTNMKQKVFAMEFRDMEYPEQIRRILALLGPSHPVFNCKSIFADYTGCGRPVVQMLIDSGMNQLTGILFNGVDVFTNTKMNLKNAMFAYTKKEIDYDRFKYPSLDNFIKSAGQDQAAFWHKMIGEWNDLVAEQGLTVNKKISSPRGGNDDTCCADILSVYAAVTMGAKRSMPKGSFGRFYR